MDRSVFLEAAEVPGQILLRQRMLEAGLVGHEHAGCASLQAHAYQFGAGDGACRAGKGPA